VHEQRKFDFQKLVTLSLGFLTLGLRGQLGILKVFQKIIARFGLH
jgi:hypothetical protein